MAQGVREASSAPRRLLNAQSPTYKWLVGGMVLFAALTETFAGNSINLAIPRLMAAFGADLPTMQWVTTTFLITRTLIIPILGWMGGIMGNRNLFVVIMIGFAIASTGCGLATNLPVLFAFRLMQGLVLGSLEGLTAVILVQAFPPRERGLALGIRTVGWSIGQIISFTVGGYCMEQISWRMLFFISVPLALFSAVLGWILIPQQRDYRGEPVDYLGLLSLGGFLIPLLLLISLGRSSETATSTLVLLGSGACLGGVYFIWQELSTAFPAVNLRLFRVPAFRLLCCTAFFNTLGLFGAQFMVPIFLQQVLGLSALQAGLVIVPALMVSGFTGLLTGRLVDIVYPPLISISGLLTLIVVFFFFSKVTALTTITVLVTYIIIYRVCMNSVSTPITILNVQVLGSSSAQVRMGQGLLGVVRNIGASLGVTVTSVFYDHRRALHQSALYDRYDAANPEHFSTLDEVRLTLQGSGMTETLDQASLTVIRQQMDTEAIAAGFRDSFLFMCIAFSIAALFIGWLTLRRLDRVSAEEVTLALAEKS